MAWVTWQISFFPILRVFSKYSPTSRVYLGRQFQCQWSDRFIALVCFFPFKVDTSACEGRKKTATFFMGKRFDWEDIFVIFNLVTK